MKRVLSSEIASRVGETAPVSGWVHARRDHGGVIFIDVRDHEGVVQLVINPEQADAFARAEELRDEFVVRATGVVKGRGEGLINPNIASGTVELVVSELEILNRAETLPIQPFSEAQANEELRLKYRYLDLRRPKMQTMLRKRAEMFSLIRTFMEQFDFTEVATPILANSSPEGARDFLIPSRLQEGKLMHSHRRHSSSSSCSWWAECTATTSSRRVFATKTRELTDCMASFTSWTLK